MKRSRKNPSPLEKFADPFLVLAIFLLFLIPALTVFNLTPIKFQRSEDDSVLGTAETTVVSVTQNLDVKDGISLVRFEKESDNSYKLKIKHITHSSGRYENVIFTIENPTDSQRTIKITSKHELTDPGTKVLVSDGKASHFLLKEDGTIYPATIYMEPDQAFNVSLIIEAPLDVNFASYIDLGMYIE